MKSLCLLKSVTTLKKLMGLSVLILASLDSSAQARAQADVNITSVTITAEKITRPTTIKEQLPGTPKQPGANGNSIPLDNVLKCRVTVHSYWDDDASQAMLVVVLPVEVSVVSHPANATVYKGGGGTSPFAGYLVFSLGDMAVQQSITVEFTFTKSAYGNKVGAYAYSATPDPNPANNYKDAVY